MQLCKTLRQQPSANYFFVLIQKYQDKPNHTTQYSGGKTFMLLCANNFDSYKVLSALKYIRLTMKAYLPMGF